MKKALWFHGMFLAAACALQGTAAAQDEAEAWDGGDETVGARLMGGRAAKQPEELPAAVWIGNCTATVVGPRTLITASHCTRTGATVRFTYKGAQYSARMTNHPNYISAGAINDVSLGVIDKEVPDMRWASISSRTLKTGEGMVHSGFGCTRWGGQLDGILRIGFATITDDTDPSDYTTSSPGQAVLCSGDSGGAAYEPFDGETFANRVVAINSKSDTHSESYVARLDRPTIRRFIVDFTQRNTLEVCGVNLECHND